MRRHSLASSCDTICDAAELQETHRASSRVRGKPCTIIDGASYPPGAFSDASLSLRKAAMSLADAHALFWSSIDFAARGAVLPWAEGSAPCTLLYTHRAGAIARGPALPRRRTDSSRRVPTSFRGFRGSHARYRARAIASISLSPRPLDDTRPHRPRFVTAALSLAARAAARRGRARPTAIATIAPARPTWPISTFSALSSASASAHRSPL